MSEGINVRKIGSVTIVRGRLIYIPPRGLDPAIRKIILDSVAAANRRIGQGRTQDFGKLTLSRQDANTWSDSYLKWTK